MPKLTQTAKAVCAGASAMLLAITTSSAQNILFQDQFNDYDPGTLPLTTEDGGPWGVVDGGSNEGAMQIVQDTDNFFGYGTSNRYLQVEDGVGFQLRTPEFGGADVVTLSLDFVDNRMSEAGLDLIGEDGTDGAERLTNQFFASLDGDPITNQDRANLFSLQNGEEIRSGAGTYPSQQRIRFDVVANNDTEAITYQSPDGTEKTLDPGLMDVWIDGDLSDASDYTFARQDDPETDPPGDGVGPIQKVTFQTFSNDGFSADIDNFTVFEGAVVGEPIPEPSTVALLMGAGVFATALFLRRRRNHG